MDRAAPSFSRRNVTIGLAGVAVAGAVATSRLFPTAEQGTRRLLASNPLTRRFLSLAEAEPEEWAAQVGSVFTIDFANSGGTDNARTAAGGYTAAGGHRLRLAGIRPLLSIGRRPPNVTRERAFLAVFEVLDGGALPGELIYTLRHGQYGRLPVFLSATDSRSLMHAVFN